VSIFGDGLVERHQQLPSDGAAIAFDLLANHRTQRIEVRTADFQIGIVLAAGIFRRFVKAFCE